MGIGIGFDFDIGHFDFDFGVGVGIGFDHECKVIFPQGKVIWCCEIWFYAATESNLLRPDCNSVSPPKFHQRPQSPVLKENFHGINASHKSSWPTQ